METIIIPKEIKTAEQFNLWIDELWLEVDELDVRKKRTGEYITIEEDGWNLANTKITSVWYYMPEKCESNFYKGTFEKAKRHIFVEVKYKQK